ncbi:MAG: hypothetical protein BM557_01155 [Flavobacterium sp. MedPE-SWcel]|uniref:hypothetical protein n=1 Tax=uncultured Flavobacterium sp. TaxID=165435 RepID=UPI0009216479|nr:hypothetical protein [uncultured Flavobacterium sp.]OIQ22015.1 MAG: hypothetical protein BM557_01155 [Flavobacterium sp. MedPE-SWcel]
MSKAQRITHFKEILATAKNLQEVARQQLKSATRLESEAISALEELGSSSGQGRKTEALTPEEKLKLMAGLTGGKSLA